MCLPSSRPTVPKTSSTLSRPMLPTRCTFIARRPRRGCAGAREWSPPCAGRSRIGGDGKVLRVLACSGDTPPGTFESVGEVHEAEAKLGLGPELQALERLEVGVVGAIARHRHVHELDRAADAGAEAVGGLHHLAPIGGGDHMAVVVL